MSATWIVQELEPGDNGTGAFEVVTRAGEVFVWTADNQAAPEDGWKTPIKQRVVSATYPGSNASVHQKLGPEHQSHRFVGMWADRHMGSGEALDTCDRFTEMVERGRDVRITHGTWSFVGTIEEFTPDLRDDAEIGYDFTFLPRYRVAGGSGVRRATPNPIALQDPEELYAQSAAFGQSLLDYQEDAPAWGFSSDYHRTVGEAVVVVQSRVAQVRAQLDSRALNPTDPIKASVQLATAYVSVAQSASLLVDSTALLNSTEGVSWDSASHLTGFESWQRATTADAILLFYQATMTARELRRRTQPQAVTLRRPFAGEHVIAFAARHGVDWRELAARNHLDQEGMVLTGDEALVIPERVG